MVSANFVGGVGIGPPEGLSRLARVVATDVPHHLTQRGNDRRFVLDCDADRSVYLSLLREKAALCKVSVIVYCLMSNSGIVSVCHACRV